MCVQYRSTYYTGNDSLKVSDIIFLWFKGCHISTRLDIMAEYRATQSLRDSAQRLWDSAQSSRDSAQNDDECDYCKMKKCVWCRLICDM